MSKSEDRGAFEKGWRQAFDDKQMAPPEGLWDKIDSELSRDESRKYKKRIFFYKLTAAASLLFAMSVGLISLYDFTGKEAQKSVSTNIEGSEQSMASIQDAARNDNGERDQDEMVEDQSQTAVDSKENQYMTDQTSVSGTENEAEASGFSKSAKGSDYSLTKEVASAVDNAGANSKDDNEEEMNDATHTPRDVVAENIENAGIGDQGHHGTKIDDRESIAYADNIWTSDEFLKGIGVNAIERIPMGYAIIPRDKKQDNVFLAGLNFSTGVFNPNFNTTGDFNAQANSLALAGAEKDTQFRLVSIADANTAEQNTSNYELPEASAMYSYGVNIGYKLSKRIVLLTGFNYTLAQAREQSSFIATDENRNSYPVSTFSEVQSADNINIKNIEGTEVVNKYEFASVPLKAGYMLFDKKFNLTLYSGVSPELMINNSIDVESEQALRVNNIDNVSAFNDLHLNGLLGVYLGYLIDDHYQLSIEPSYKQSLTSLIRDENALDSYPSYFLVSFGLAYQFR